MKGCLSHLPEGMMSLAAAERFGFPRYSQIQTVIISGLSALHGGAIKDTEWIQK